jgi:hypothetical protein
MSGRLRTGCSDRRQPASIRVETLESRQLLAAMPAQVVMLAATTLDSKGITVDYQVNNAALGRPLVLGVYRSASPTFDASAVPVGSVTVPISGVDASGVAATAVGTHHLTVPLAGGLPPNPLHPYVLVVVANPSTAASATPTDTASFRVSTIGVIIHGGIQNKGWTASGPPWEQTMAASLKAEGYDRVIAYNWVARSSTPGDAVREVPQVDKLIEAAAESLPAGPVDLQIIGHSEGAVIAGQAMTRLQPVGGLAQGYRVLTVLDPHAASNNFKGKQASVASGLVGSIAKSEIDAYQSKAKDPAPYIPANVDDAQVYFQRTPIGAANGSNNGLYNLWGQVPVLAAPGVPVHYANLTGPGISHAGNFSVFDWYQINVVPKLGEGTTFVDPNALTATANGAVNGSVPTTFSGTAASGATVQILGLQVTGKGRGNTVEIGSAPTDASGRWTVTPARGILGVSRYFARSDFPAMPGLPRVYTPTTIAIQTGS